MSAKTTLPVLRPSPRSVARDHRRSLLAPACSRRAPPLAGSLLLVAVVLGRANPSAAESPREVARAGASLVSDDGIGAAVANPAGMARRSSWRVQAGVTVSDDDVEANPDTLIAAGVAPADAVVGSSRGAPQALPHLGAFVGWGPLVLGATWTGTHRGRALPSPQPDQAAEDVLRQYPYRYAGIAGEWVQHTSALAAAARVNDWLAIGASATIGIASATERRRIWAGLPNSAVPVGSPERDVDLELRGSDYLVPGAACSLFIAPPQAPIEVAVATSWTNSATIRGDVSATAVEELLDVDDTFGASSLALPGKRVAQLGVRAFSERFSGELLVARHWWAPQSAPVWNVEGVALRDVSGDISGDILGDVSGDVSGVSAPITTLPSRWAPRSYVSFAASVDVEVIPGVAWLTAGYGWHGAEQDLSALAPNSGRLAEHTGGVGIEISSGGVTATIGYSRSVGDASGSSSRLGLDNPFATTDASVGPGPMRTVRDTIAVLVDFSSE